MTARGAGGFGPGRLGGVRVISRLRDLLAELGVITVPGFVTLAGPATAFTEDGQLADTDAEDGLARPVRRLIAAGRLIAR